MDEEKTKSGMMWIVEIEAVENWLRVEVTW